MKSVLRFAVTLLFLVGALFVLRMVISEPQPGAPANESARDFIIRTGGNIEAWDRRSDFERILDEGELLVRFKETADQHARDMAWESLKLATIRRDVEKAFGPPDWTQAGRSGWSRYDGQVDVILRGSAWPECQPIREWLTLESRYPHVVTVTRWGNRQVESSRVEMAVYYEQEGHRYRQEFWVADGQVIWAGVAWEVR